MSCSLSLLHGRTGRFSTAFFEIYPGAILLNQGTEYRIVLLDTDELVAHAVECNVNYFTKSRDHADIQVFGAVEQRPAAQEYRDNGVSPTAMRLGQCLVHTQFYGHRK